MSKLNYLLTGIVAFGLGAHTTNFIHNSNRQSNVDPAPIVQTHPSALEDCVIKGIITDSNIPVLKRERIRMRASGLYPIKVELSVNDGPNQGRYVVNIEGFTNPKDGTPKSEDWKEGYQDLFDIFFQDLTRGDAFPIPCVLFDSLRSIKYPLITKLP